MPNRNAKRQTISNELAFDRYRKIVESDARGATAPDDDADETMLSMYGIAGWGSRYSRRRNVLEGRAGWADPLSDTIACELLVCRNAQRDAGLGELPDWDAETLPMIEMSMRHSYGLSLQEPHAHGPSLRHLWREAKGGGLSDREAWLHVLRWAHHAPPSFKREADRLRRKQEALGAEHNLLERPVEWSSTGDLEIPWEADAEGSRWQVRLNDFPDAVMYTLIADGREVGDFHDWPQCWSREGQPAVVQESVDRVTRPAAAGSAAARWPDRYASGEHEAVWAEMVSVGPEVRSKGNLKPARAVAGETMRRARANIEMLIPRLRALGYEFYRPKRPPMGDPLMMMGINGLGSVRRMSDVLSEVLGPKSGRSAQGPLDAGAGALADVLARIVGQRTQADESTAAPVEEAHGTAFTPSTPDDRAILTRLEKRGILLPLSLHAWISEVGRVDLTGSHPTLCFMNSPKAEEIQADPLAVIPMADDVEEQMEDWHKSEGLRSVQLFVSFLPRDKAFLGSTDDMIEDGYEIAIPDSGADGLLQGADPNLMFVDYLRLAFKFGGFPGWARHSSRPDDELMKLSSGLHPL